MKEETRRRWFLVILVVILGVAAILFKKPSCPPCPCLVALEEPHTIEGEHWSQWATKEYLRLEREGLIEPNAPATIKVPK